MTGTSPPTAQDTSIPKETQEAVEHYRRTSAMIKRDEIRQGYKEVCHRVAKRFGLERMGSAQ